MKLLFPGVKVSQNINALLYEEIVWQFFWPTFRYDHALLAYRTLNLQAAFPVTVLCDTLQAECVKAWKCLRLIEATHAY